MDLMNTRSNTEDVLSAIDNALNDYNTSCDAMRWTPEPVIESPIKPYNHNLNFSFQSTLHYSLNTNVEAQCMHYQRALGHMGQIIQSTIPAMEEFGAAMHRAFTHMPATIFVDPPFGVCIHVPLSSPRAGYARQRRIETQMRRRDRRRTRQHRSYP